MPDPLPGWLTAASRITVLTGAGISTESGIPDFRGPQGVWTRDPEAEKLSALSWYVADPDVRRRAWQERLHHPAREARPDAGHAVLVDLERQGRLRALLTQNIDGLHQAAGSSPERVLELHGTVPVGGRVVLRPACTTCGGILKSATISFGQALDAAVIGAAAEAAADCDVFLAVGTSLTVHPAAGLVAAAQGARVVLRVDTVRALAATAGTGAAVWLVLGG